MKKLVYGRLYNTETAELIHDYQWGYPSDFKFIYEALYKTKKGNYFIYGEGGAMSKYCVKVESNTWESGSDIIPISVDEAVEWLEENDGSEAIEKYFTNYLQEA